MTENSVIKHYKKQLIYRQHDSPSENDDEKDTKIYEFVESDSRNHKLEKNSTKKMRRKRKNKNCRGQFRHEGMELIKLGTNTSNSLCKPKDSYNARSEKPPPNSTKEEEKKSDPTKETNKRSVIQSNFVDKTIILEEAPPKPPAHGHALPQMIPEPERRASNHKPSPPTIYSSPPPLQVPTPEYRVPMPYMPFPQNAYRSYPGVHSPPHHLPPPPYPLARSPPRPVPRPPVRPVPCHFQKPSPPHYIHYPFASYPNPPVTKQNGYPPPIAKENGYPQPIAKANGYPPPIAKANGHPPPIAQRLASYLPKDGAKKRKLPSDDKHHHCKQMKETPQIVAAIDLTVDQKEEKVLAQKNHKCQCECGKTYSSDSLSQEVIITVPAVSSQVPTTYLRGKVVNGVFRLDNQVDCNFNNVKNKPQPNGTTKKNNEIEEISKPKPPPTKNIEKDEKTSEKLPQLFLIKDLLAKGVRVERKSSTSDEKTKIGTNAEPNRVIVGPKKQVEESRIRNKSQDHSVRSIMSAKNRRQSVDIDTISISSSSSESVRSPRPKSDILEKQIPQGKLFYYKNNNSFIRYFDDTQKKLFINNVMADGRNCPDDREIIELPKNMAFSNKDSLTVEEYVTEMTLAEKFIPKDFFLFYKFVTGYQICNNNLPVSFLTFLKVYNTNGLKVLLERYVNSLKQTV